MKNTQYLTHLLPVLFFALISPLALAGGLDDATDAINDLKVWLYGFLGTFAICYLVYHVIMAMMEKETWGDVMVAVAKVAAAGGVIVAGEWAWGLWGN